MSNENQPESGISRTRPETDGDSSLPSLELYTHEFCPYCHTVIDLMEEIGIMDSVVLHDVLQDPEEMETLIRMTGKKQVPCLVVDGKPMHESRDIKSFLFETFAGT